MTPPTSPGDVLRQVLDLSTQMGEAVESGRWDEATTLLEARTEAFDRLRRGLELGTLEMGLDDVGLIRAIQESDAGIIADLDSHRDRIREEMETVDLHARVHGQYLHQPGEEARFTDRRS